MTNAPSYDGYSKYTGSVAATYDSDRQVEAQWWKEDQFVREYFSETIAPRLLDIPVGTGRFFPHYRRTGTVVGVDVSEDMLNEARLKLASLPSGTAGSVERGDVFSLRFNDHEFTHAVVWRLLHLIPEHLLGDAVTELCRVTAREIVVQTYPAALLNSGAPEPTYRRRIAAALRRIRRSLLPPPPAARSAGEGAHDAKPWSHINSYAHRQDAIDALFLAHGFRPRLVRHLDTYDSCQVTVTVYQR
jgi:ubiquinone/menaquinone biosynthesis C-methylase UbiE